MKNLIINWIGCFNLFFGDAPPSSLSKFIFKFTSKTNLARYINKLLSNLTLHFPEVITLYYALFSDKNHTKNDKLKISLSALDKGFMVTFNCVKILCKVLGGCESFLTGFRWLLMVVGEFTLSLDL